MEEKTKKISIYRIIKIIFLVVIIIASLSFVSSLLNTNIIPDKYMTTIYIGVLIVNLLISLFIVIKNKIVNIMGFIMILVLCPVMLGVKNYVDKTVNLFENIISNNEERTSYYILGNGDKYNDLQEVKGKNVGVLSSENELVKNKLKEDNNFEYKYYEIIGDLLAALENNELDAIVLSSSLYEYLEEEDTSYIEYLKKLGSIEIDGTNENITSEIDVNKPFLLYISGVDGREATSISSYGLSDINIIVAVNPQTHKVLLVQIPSNYYVKLNGKEGMDKLTNTGLYGIGMSMKTVADIFDVDINTYVKVDFKALKPIVNGINGVNVNSKLTFNSYHMPGWTVNEGINNLDGDKALAYARERAAYKESEYHSGENPDEIVSAIIKKLTSDSYYLNKYDSILSDCQSYITTNFNKDDIQNFIKNQVDRGARWNFENYKVKGTDSMNYTTSFPKIYTYVMISNQDDVNIVKNKINAVIGG